MDLTTKVYGLLALITALNALNNFVDCTDAHMQGYRTSANRLAFLFCLNFFVCVLALIAFFS